MAFAHLAVFCKSPIFKAVTALPFHVVMRILILVPELDRDFIFGEGEELLAEAVALLLLPFLGQKFLDRGSTGNERGTISPDAVRGVRFGDSPRVSAGVREATD